MAIAIEALLNQNITVVFDSFDLASIDSIEDLEQVVQQASIPGLASCYELRNSAEVDAYGAKHPQLTGFLFDSYKQLRTYFDAAASFALEVVRDPEISPPSDFLFVNIRTSMPVDEAMERLEQFDEAWYLDQADAFGELVNFNLEFYEL